MQPVLTLEALKHVELRIIDLFLIMWRLAMAVYVKVVVTVLVPFVLIIFIVLELTTLRHVAVPAIAAEIEF